MRNRYEELNIPLRDAFIAKGRWQSTGNTGAPARPVVVFSHGLAGSSNEAHFFFGARTLCAAGFDVVMFDYYHSDAKTRCLTDCALSTHANDLDDALQFVRTRVSNAPIAVVGHSLGGLIALEAKEQYDALVLWDATHAPRSHHLFADLSLDVKRNAFVRGRAVEYLISRQMVEEFTGLYSDQRIAALHTPVCIIGASNGQPVGTNESYFAHANEPKEFHMIDGADHCFLSGDSFEELLSITTTFLKKYLF